MPEHLHLTRPLAPGEPDEPTEAWIEYPDGRRTDLALTRTGPRTWIATGSVPSDLDSGAHLRLDRLCPGGAVAFVNDVAPEDTPSHGDT